MRTNYFLKSALTFGALFCFMAVSTAETPKIPTFTDISSEIVTGEEGAQPFTFGYEAAAAWGDYNNDGYLDLATFGNSHGQKMGALYKNNGGLNFTKQEVPFPALTAAGAAWLDYDNDGNLDLFIAGRLDGGRGEGETPTLYTGLWRNLGPEGNYEFEQVFEGQFAPMDNEGGNKPNRYIAVADYDNDGWVDIYIQGMDEDGYRVAYLYKNYKGLAFLSQDTPVRNEGEEQPLVQWNAGTTQFGDFNNDGYMDLTCFGYGIGEDDYVRLYGKGFGYEQTGGAVYKNSGDGAFAQPIFYAGGDSGDVIWLDVNSDGKLDMAVTGYSWFQGAGWQGDIQLNNGDGTFQRFDPAATGLHGGQNTSLAAGDLNNNGYDDILYMEGNPGEGVKDGIYLNNFGNNSFTKSTFSYDHAYRGGTACLVDFDRDNDLDAFIIAYDDSDPQIPRLMRNDLGEGISVNEAPSVPANLQYTVDEESGDITFTWDASTDDITPQAVIKYNLFVKKIDGTIISILPANIESGYLKVNDQLAPLTTTFYTLKGWELEKGDQYGVQAIDGAKVTSKFIVKTVGGNSISSVAQDNIEVFTNGKTIEVTADATGTVNVYSVSGMNVANVEVNSSVELAAGVYVVKVTTANGSLVKKVILK